MHDMLLHLELTDRCNLRCEHCYRSSSPRDLDFALACRILRDGRRLGAERLSFGGAEPTLHPRFIELIAAGAEEGYQVSIGTHGTGFQRYLPELRRLRAGSGPGLHRVNVSLDGGSKAVHDRIRSDGSHKAAVTALMLAKSAGFETRAKTVVNRANVDDLEELLRLAGRIGGDILQSGPPVPTRNLVRAGLMLSPAETARAAERLAGLARAYAVPLEISFAFGGDSPYAVCDVAQWRTLSVDASGRMPLCCLLSLSGEVGHDAPWIVGDLSERSLASVFQEFTRAAHLLLERRAEMVRRREGVSEAGLFPCAMCAALHGQLDWLREFPESPWTALLDDAALAIGAAR